MIVRRRSVYATHKKLKRSCNRPSQSSHIDSKIVDEIGESSYTRSAGPVEFDIKNAESVGQDNKKTNTYKRGLDRYLISVDRIDTLKSADWIYFFIGAFSME